MTKVLTEAAWREALAGSEDSGRLESRLSIAGRISFDKKFIKSPAWLDDLLLSSSLASGNESLP